MRVNRRLVISIGITALFGAAVVQAEELGRAHVRFAFETRDQRMEAGTYTAVEKEGVLLVRNNTTAQGVFLLPVLAGLSNSDESSMTFRCYGSDCFLSKIQFGGTHKVYEINPSNHEKELATVKRPQITTVAMR